MAYIFIRMGNSPRPALWILEKSADYGKTWQPWQYFSDSPDDCEHYFGRDSLQPITRDDSVVCTIEYSKIVPLEGGEVILKMVLHVWCSIVSGILDTDLFAEQQAIGESLF